MVFGARIAEPVRAPADGVIATLINTFPDQPIGSVDLQNPAGNQVVLKIGEGTFIAFGHLQSGSISVSAGQSVRRGDIIGLVGNSGNSDEPHLHVQAQDKAIFDVNKPPGLITYPLLFDDVQVMRNDRVLPAQPADLRRGDRFSTIG
ncbi:MAG TPA: M23 family metallopeptidase [Propionibacteriaceae bacterium]|nr:M23 family metallopeptidase [Propionibacteriaceae bacterium]